MNAAKIQSIPREFARWQKAQQQYVAGRYGPAVNGYRTLVARYPTVPELWCELGMAAAGNLEFELADRALSKAMELATTQVSLLTTIGQQYYQLRQLDKARICFERAVAADPSSVEARLTLASWLERERKLDDAVACVDECLAQHPGDRQARYVQALLLQRKGQNAEAESLLRDLIERGPRDLNLEASCHHLLGVVLDALGQHAAAMESLLEAKRKAARLANVASMERDYDEADRRRRAVLEELTPDAIGRWQTDPPPDPDKRQLAFLGGHPRSGTTLLEQLLNVHPEIVTFDESGAFVVEVWNQLWPMKSPGLTNLKDLEGLSQLRRTELSRRYFKSLLQGVTDYSAQQVLVDKNPSPTSALPLWLRLFPGLKVIVTLRDPRDVVLSCFKQNLMLNPTNVNFLSIERAARHYSNLMDVWLRMRELGGFEWIESRYEDLLDDVEKEGRRVTEFLGKTWLPEQLRPHQSAGTRVVYSPTFHDVARPLYKTSVGRWQCYAEALAPVQDTLRKYCLAFGYSVD